MKYITILLTCATCASAVRMEQVLVEEPTQTNRSAAAWAAAPLVTPAATWEFFRTRMARSSYGAALTLISPILATTTERFSTSWSYIFREGGGVGVDVLEVRATLDVSKPVFSPGTLTTRFLSVTNSGYFSTIEAHDVALSGTGLEGGSAIESSASITTAGVFSTSHLVGGDILFDAPAVLFTRAPVLLKVGSAGDTGGWESCSVIKYVGMLPIGAYYDGLLKLDMIRTSTGVAHSLVGMGLGAGGTLHYAPTGPALAAVSLANVPVLVTHYPVAEPRFFTGFWKRSPEDADAASIVMTSAVSRCFAILASNEAIASINGGTNVASYASVASLNIDSPSLGAVFRVADWRDALTNTVAGLALASGAGGVVATNSLGTIFTNSWDTVVVTNVALEVVTNTLVSSTITSTLGTSLTNSYGELMAGMTNISVSVSNYVAATDILLDPTTGLLRETAERGVVAIATRRDGGQIEYNKYRQMLTEEPGYYRVTMQLSFRDPDVLPSDTTARYWLVMNGKKILSHSVSSAGETGPAFAFIDTTRSMPGYLYLDFSEFVAIHGINVLKGATYYVKLESLRGLDLWHNQ